METLKKLLGPNWNVKILGWLTALFTYIALEPHSVEFLPDWLEDSLVGSAKLLMVISGGATASVLKGSKVTGGSVAATTEAKVRVYTDGELPRALPVDPMDLDSYERVPRPLVILED